MRVRIQNQVVELSDKDILGRGGEADVYGHGTSAVKVYRGLSATELAQKETKLSDFPKGLPHTVLGPQHLVYSARKKRQLIGFTMRRLAAAFELGKLQRRRFRDGTISNDSVCRIFCALHDLLTDVHSNAVVVGDLNAANVLVAGEAAHLIDADSMQYDGHHCVVAHEHVLDPKLYGVDFARGGAFSTQTDWYAFTVLLFASLLYVHPYGGVQDKLPTLKRRAEARHSVFRDDVRLPKVAGSVDVLSDELGQWFRGVFESGVRDTFPRRLIEGGWAVCPQCSLEHGRGQCPRCIKTNAAALALPPTRHNGRCRATRVFESRGRIHAVHASGRLRYVFEKEGAVVRENGRRVMNHPPELGTRFEIAGDTTWVGFQGTVVGIRDEKVVHRGSTDVVRNSTCFSSNRDACFISRDGWLTEVVSGRRIGQILEGQTWFRAGERVGYGFFRAGRITEHFLFSTKTSSTGLISVDLPNLVGRLTDVTCAFDRNHVLVRHTSETQSSLHLIRNDGAVVASLAGAHDASPLLSPATSFAIMGGRVVAASDDGLISYAPDAVTKRLVVQHVFTDTEPFVRQGAEIQASPGGSIHLITPRAVLQLALT